MFIHITSKFPHQFKFKTDTLFVSDKITNGRIVAQKCLNHDASSATVENIALNAKHAVNSRNTIVEQSCIGYLKNNEWTPPVVKSRIGEVYRFNKKVQYFAGDDVEQTCLTDGCERNTAVITAFTIQYDPANRR